MSCKEIEIPFKNNGNSKRKKKILKDGIKIFVKSFFIYDKIQKALSFTDEDEQEFINSIELNNRIKKACISVK